ncbi:MAG: recombinase family protein, partial [Vibrio fluvialis]
MKTAAMYVRVSTQRQVDEDTISSQIAQLEAYAQEQGYQIEASHRFIDEAVSGKGLNRPALNRLRDTMMSGTISTILCLGPDRLARNYGVQQFLLDEWRRLGVTVCFINQPRPVENAQDALLLNIQGAFAEYERTVISDRMQRGRRHRLRRGESAPYPAPYGYSYQAASGGQGARWHVDQAQAVVVEQVYNWYVSEALTIGQIRQRLNGQKTPAPQGSRWSDSSVRRMLCQSAYRGTAYYGRKQADYNAVGLPRRKGAGRLQYPRYQSRPVEAWITVAVPALVTAELWQQAQEKRAMNTKMSARNSQRSYLLRGLLQCGICQSLMTGRTQKERVSYYCRHGGVNRAPHIAPHSCTIGGDVVESAVWSALAQLLDQPALVQDAWEHYRQSLTQPPTDVNRKQKRVTSLKEQKKRLLRAYQNGIVDYDELTECATPISMEITELERSLATAAKVEAVGISLEEFTAQIAQALNAPDVETQQDVIRLLIERIIVNNDEIVIEHIVPIDDQSRLRSAQHATRN